MPDRGLTWNGRRMGERNRRRGAPEGPRRLLWAQAPAPPRVGPQRPAGGSAPDGPRIHLCPVRTDRGLRQTVPRILISGGLSAGTTTFVTTMCGAASPAGAVGDAGEVAFTQGRLPAVRLLGVPAARLRQLLRSQPQHGLIGAVVLADPRRLTDSFGLLDDVTHHRVPYLVAVNLREHAPRYPIEEIREVLAVDPAVPVIEADPRKRTHALGTLVCLVEYALRTAAGPPRPPAGSRS